MHISWALLIRETCLQSTAAAALCHDAGSTDAAAERICGTQRAHVWRILAAIYTPATFEVLLTFGRDKFCLVIYLL